MKQLLIATVAMLLLAACSHSSRTNAPKESSSVADGNISTRVTVKDSSVLIDYTDTKRGDTTLLFVHGWLIDKTYFSNQVTYFQDKYRVVTIDLPGYGQSGKNRKSWEIKDFGRDVDSVITELNLNKVVLIGHSMSGDIVLDAAIHDTQRVIGIVGIDNFKSVGVPENPGDTKSFQEAIKAMKKNFTPVVSGYFNQALFSKDTDSSTRKRVLTDVSQADPAIAIATMESQEYDETAVLKKWPHPLYVVNSDYTPTDTSAMHRLAMPFYVAGVSHSGHFPMIEQPQAFNKALQQIIDLIGAEKTSVQ